MPKKGYTQIIVSNEVREILGRTARESGFRTVNELLKYIIESTMLSRVNPKLTPTPYNTIKLSLIPTLNQENRQKQVDSLKQKLLSEGSFEKGKFLVARGRFELPSTGPKPAMLVRYTTGLPDQESCRVSIFRFSF